MFTMILGFCRQYTRQKKKNAISKDKDIVSARYDILSNNKPETNSIINPTKYSVAKIIC